MKMNIHTSLVLFVSFTAANLLSAVAADFNSETCGGMCLKVLSRSGKVLFRRCRNNKNFAKAFTVEMDAIRREEGDEIDELVPKFQDFTFAELESTQLQNLTAKKLSATAYFKAQKAYLHLDIYTLCEDGVIKFDDDEIVLRTGSMKLFLRLENYLPSGTNDIVLPLIVRGRLGQYPNESEEIKTDDDRPDLTRNIPCWSRGKCGRHFRFGDGDGTDDEMSFASKCKVDGKFIYFSSEDYPKLENYTSSETKDIELGLIVQGRKDQNPKKDEDIKGSDGKHKKLNRKMPCRKIGKCGKHFRFGDGNDTDDEMSAANKCKVNGKFSNFSSFGYPKLEQMGKKYRIAFRVPANFSKSIEIDPGVTLGDELDEEDDKDDKNDKDDKEGSGVSVHLNLLLLILMVVAISACNREQ